MRLVHERIRGWIIVCVRGGGMVFRTAGAIAALLIGLGTIGNQASAQYYPPPQAFPPPQAYPPPQPYPAPQGYPPPPQAYPPLPRVADAEDHPPIYDQQGRPLPPA